jgi:hypothetical protein
MPPPFKEAKDWVIIARLHIFSISELEDRAPVQKPSFSNNPYIKLDLKRSDPSHPEADCHLV